MKQSARKLSHSPLVPSPLCILCIRTSDAPLYVFFCTLIVVGPPKTLQLFFGHPFGYSSFGLHIVPFCQHCSAQSPYDRIGQLKPCLFKLGYIILCRPLLPITCIHVLQPFGHVYPQRVVSPSMINVSHVGNFVLKSCRARRRSVHTSESNSQRAQHQSGHHQAKCSSMPRTWRLENLPSTHAPSVLLGLNNVFLHAIIHEATVRHQPAHKTLAHGRCVLPTTTTPPHKQSIQVEMTILGAQWPRECGDESRKLANPKPRYSPPN